MKTDNLFNVLRPLAIENEAVIRQQASQWAESIRQMSNADEATQAHLLELLTQFIVQRFRHLTRKEIDKMLQLTPLEETVAGKELIQIGLEKGLEKGVEQGIQQAMQADILDILETRFGYVPKKVTEAVEGITDTAVLKTLLRRAATINSLAAFEQQLAKEAETHIQAEDEGS